MTRAQVLAELDSTWSSMVFDHEPHSRTGTMLLKVNEELVETLEDNQVPPLSHPHQDKLRGWAFTRHSDQPGTTGIF